MNISQRLKINFKVQDAQIKVFSGKVIGNQEFSRILDVGCGNGFFSFFCKDSTDEIHGIDVYDFYDRKFLKKYFRKVVFKRYDGKKIPYPKDFFDFVFSMDVLEHVNDPLGFLKEQLRVLKKGGLFLVGTPNLWRLGNFLLLFLGQLHFPRKLCEDKYGSCIHLREYNKKNLTLLMKEIGIKDYSLLPCYLGIYNFGFISPPKKLENFCQFWFLFFKKQV